jgi:GDP/GTP exchange factor required for growth at low temperature
VWIFSNHRLNQIPADGSFVETSSGPAARELKRRYDQHFGVGISVRSPYAITAFVNQHGKQTFRVG